MSFAILVQFWEIIAAVLGGLIVGIFAYFRGRKSRDSEVERAESKAQSADKLKGAHNAATDISTLDDRERRDRLRDKYTRN